jgi:hypothetical protein
MNTIVKLYDRLLLERLRAVIVPHLRKNQSGFLPKRSTVEQIMTLKILFEMNLKLVITFIDFSNAFPSISWKSIEAALKAFSVPAPLITAVMSVYHEHLAFVRTSEGTTEGFHPSAGVLQGDTLAPFLFVLVLDLLLRAAIDEPNLGLRLEDAKGPSVRISDLDYADDIALLSTTEAEAQTMLSNVAAQALRVGLAINISKTEFIATNFDTPVSLSLNNVPLNKVDDYRYLGSFLSSDTDVAARVGQAWRTMSSLAPVWKSVVVSDNNKIQLWRTMVEPILLYGAGAYALTAKRSAKLRGTTTRMIKTLRQMPPTQHATLAEIYGIHNLISLSPAQLAEPTVCHDLPQLTTTLALRQIQFLSKFVYSHPSHPLTLLLSRKREPQLRITLESTIAKHLGITDNNTPITAVIPDPKNAKHFAAMRAQLLEDTVLQNQHRRHAAAKLRTKLADLISSNLHRFRSDDEDAPIAASPLGVLLGHPTTRARAKHLAQFFPDLIPDASVFLAPINSKFVPKTNRTTTTTETRLEISSTIRLSGAIFHATDSDLNRFIPPMGNCKTPFDAEMRTLLLALCNCQSHESIHLLVSKRALQLIPTLAWKYTRRILRKHILWKHVFFLLRARNTLALATQFSILQQISSDGLDFINQHTTSDSTHDDPESEKEEDG